MSTTPLTDCAVDDTALENKNAPHTDWVTAHFARTLETRLARLEAIAEGLYDALERQCPVTTEHGQWKDAALIAYRAFKEERL